jgi:cytochrome c oxidase assembly protein subunit 11
LEDQTLGPHEEAVFPVVYYVDPELASDIETADVSAVTLSYTYFRSLDEAARVLEENATRE